MYPPRSAKHKQKKKQKQQRQTKVWTIINLMLIVAVCLVGLYIYYSSNGSTSAGNRPAASASENGTGPLDSGVTATSGTKMGTGSSSNTDHTDVQPSADPGGSTASAADAHHGGTNGQQNSGSNTPASSPDSSALGTNTASANVDQNKGADTVSAGSPGDLVIHFGGDTLFSGKVEAQLEKSGYDFPFQYVKGLFTQDDLTLLNLETPVTDGGVGATDKQYVFKSSPKALDAMAQAGVEAVNLANNHTLDQGEEGLLDTLDHLKSAGIASVGAGANADQAYAPQYFERKGLKIAVFGFSRVLPKADWAAGVNKPGIASIYDPARAYAAVKAARQKADLVIVITHWGKERVQQFDNTQTTLAHGLIDAGADLVVGGHPHVLQGLEQYKGKWVAYSTGNFIFTRSSNAKTWETSVFEARCSKSGSCSMKLIPYSAELGQPVPMTAEKGAKLLQEIQALSPGVTVDKAGNVSAK